MTDSNIDKAGTRGWLAGLTTAGGITSAFGVAACCALPILLSGAGLSVGWLAGIAALTSPYRSVLIVVSALCLGIALWQVARVRPGGAPLWLRLVLLLGIVVGAVLLVLGYLYA